MFRARRPVDMSLPTLFTALDYTLGAAALAILVLAALWGL